MQAEELSAAIAVAERYPSLASEVEAARGLMERWAKRAEAQVRRADGAWDNWVGGGLEVSKPFALHTHSLLTAYLHFYLHCSPPHQLHYLFAAAAGPVRCNCGAHVRPARAPAAGSASAAAPAAAWRGWVRGTAAPSAAAGRRCLCGRGGGPRGGAGGGNRGGAAGEHRGRQGQASAQRAAGTGGLVGGPLHLAVLQMSGGGWCVLAGVQGLH